MAVRGLATAVVGMAGYEVLQFVRVTRQTASEVVVETGAAVRTVIVEIAVTVASVRDAIQGILYAKTYALERLIGRAGQAMEQVLVLLVPLAAVCMCVIVMTETQKFWASTVRDALTKTGFNPKGMGLKQSVEEWLL